MEGDHPLNTQSTLIGHLHWPDQAPPTVPYCYPQIQNSRKGLSGDEISIQTKVQDESSTFFIVFQDITKTKTPLRVPTHPYLVFDGSHTGVQIKYCDHMKTSE